MKRKIIRFSAEIILINFISLFLLFNFNTNATQRKNPFGGASVKVHNRKDKHIKTAALICALAETKASLKEINIALFNQFPKPINASDEFLIVDSMLKMCPLNNPKNIIDMATQDLQEVLTRLKVKDLLKGREEFSK